MDPNTLRILLIVAGALLLIGLYLWERRRTRRDAEEPRQEREPAGDKPEPQLGDWYGDELGDSRLRQTGDDALEMNGARGSPASSSPDSRTDRTALQSELDLEAPLPTLDEEHPAKAPPRGPSDPLILSFHITPVAGVFQGEGIVHAAARCNLDPGEMDIFHRYRNPQSQTECLFSMANMVKPGTFPLGGMAGFTTPGLTLFTQVHGAAEDPARLEEMLSTAHCLAAQLKAEIHDENREPLTPQAEERLRDRVLGLMTARLSERAGK